MITADGWQDYELIDTGGGEKLERWGTVKVIRPDPQIIWPRSDGRISPGRQDNADGENAINRLWQDVHMHYRRSKSGGGHWEILKPVPDQWTITYGDLRFHIRPTDFKHMGLFPEQAINWEWAAGLIKEAGRPIRVLNLFGYTGGATVACLNAGADVTHVDAAKGMNQWAKENIALLPLRETQAQAQTQAGQGQRMGQCRIITDDVMKFVKREARRRSFYDAIIMDPPSFGRGPSGELWKLEDRLFDLVEACADILSEQPLFMLLNAYTAGFSPSVAENILKMVMTRCDSSGVLLRNGHVTGGEIGLKTTTGGLVLPCGLFGRWEA